MRLQVLKINCEGMSPNRNALRWICLVHLFCWFTVLRGLLVMIFQHRFPACTRVTSSRYWIWWCSQFSGIFTKMILWSRCWRRNAAGIWWQSWYNEKCWVANRQSNLTSLFWSIVEFRRFPFIRISVFFFLRSPWSNRIGGDSSSNCTVANRSRSWTKSCAYSFICTVPGRGKSHMVFWTLSKYPLYLSLNLSCSALCIEEPKYTINIRSSVSLAPSQENKT